MAKKSDNDKRWFDQEDFTPEHDVMMQDLLKNWKRYLRVAENRIIYDNVIESCHLVGEPILDGYPPVFPDGGF